MGMNNIPVQEFDVVIVGSGGAGQRAALQLAQSNYKVAVLCKVFPTRAHTVSAQGGIAASLGNVDSDHWQWHMYDTVRGSDYLGDQDAIQYMCQEANAAVYELEHYGMPFSRLDDGRIYQRAFGGHTRHFGKEMAHRTCAVADRTGHAIIHTLFQKNVEAKTNFYSEWFALDLVKGDTGRIAGVIALNMANSEIVFFKARAVVLATGGGGRLYETTSNAYTNTGDGLGMALRAGLPVEDMEFWQFHPTGVYGVGCLISESVRGEGGYLLNKDGERFMERYSPHLKDLECRDIVARSIMTEILEGRGCGPQQRYVLLKVDHVGEEVIRTRLPGIRELSIKFAGVDPVKDPIPVAPTCHYMMGGIPTTMHGQVLTHERGQEQIVEGLYAAGECACVSVHGANRLGTNSLLDLVVFGRAVGLDLEDKLARGLDYAHVKDDAIDAAMSRYRRWERDNNTEDMADIRHHLKKTMSEHFGVFREEKKMEEGLRILRVLAERLQKAKLIDRSTVFNMARFEALELDNLMEIGIATAVGALNRKESRGAHSRYDYTERDDKNWLKHSLYFKEGAVAYRPVNMKPRDMEPVLLAERE